MHFGCCSSWVTSSVRTPSSRRVHSIERCVFIGWTSSNTLVVSSVAQTLSQSQALCLPSTLVLPVLVSTSRHKHFGFKFFKSFQIPASSKPSNLTEDPRNGQLLICFDSMNAFHRKHFSGSKSVKTLKSSPSFGTLTLVPPQIYSSIAKFAMQTVCVLNFSPF